MSATSIINACLAMEQLTANLRAYHAYLLEDECVNPRVLAWVEGRISFQDMRSRRNDSTGSGALGGSQRGMSSSGRIRSSDSREKEIATT